MRVINSISSFVVLALVLAAGCANPVLPPRDNPRDSVGTNYHHPGIELLSGPTNDSIVHQSDIMFRWRGTGKADSFKWILDGSRWCEWTTQDSVRFPYLDEGYHSLLLCAKARYGIEQQTPLVCSFTIKTIPLPALVAVPWHQIPDSVNKNSVLIIADSVYGFAQAQIVLQYDPAALRYLRFSYDLTLNRYAASITTQDSSSPGVVNIVIRLNQPSTGVSGTFRIASIVFEPLNVSHSAAITMTMTSVLRDVAGDTIALQTRRGAVIDPGP